MSAWSKVAQALQSAVADALDRKLAARRPPERLSRAERTHRGTRPWPPRARARRKPSPGLGEDYPGDFSGPLTMEYTPAPGHLPDPGEVVWAWVPYEEDHRRGKDRPVLLIGRDGEWLLGLPLTSKDHDRDAAQEAGQGRHWVDIGAGAWDDRGRESEARTDRIIRVHPDRVRHDGVRVSREVFDRVAAEVRRHRRS